MRGLSVALLCCAAGASQAGLVNLSASMTADNAFNAYISTDPNAAGTEFLSGSSWGTAYQGSVDLDAPGTYYLHIHAVDVGRPAMFIGNFTLSNSEAVFSNGTQELLTDASTGDWSASLTGFGGADVGVTDLGPNGTSPWGNFAAMGDARFIWSNGSPSPLVVDFSTTITVLPAPGAAGVLAVGGLVAARRRR